MKYLTSAVSIKVYRMSLLSHTGGALAHDHWRPEERRQEGWVHDSNRQWRKEMVEEDVPLDKVCTDRVANHISSDHFGNTRPWHLKLNNWSLEKHKDAEFCLQKLHQKHSARWIQHNFWRQATAAQIRIPTFGYFQLCLSIKLSWCVCKQC